MSNDDAKPITHLKPLLTRGIYNALIHDLGADMTIAELRRMDDDELMHLWHVGHGRVQQIRKACDGIATPGARPKNRNDDRRERAVEMRRQGMILQDIAQALGITRQRAQQLVRDVPHPNRWKNRGETQ